MLFKNLQKLKWLKFFILNLTNYNIKCNNLKIKSFASILIIRIKAVSIKILKLVKIILTDFFICI